MKIYTKTGDQGQTGLFGGARVAKSDPRIDAFGTVDELNAVLGLLLTEALSTPLRDRFIHLQHELFDLGADLATPLDVDAPSVRRIAKKEIERLETEIDEAEKNLPALTAFILPGGSRSAALIHLSRTLCRRAERACSELLETGMIHPLVLVYLNRLSDWLFVMARIANQEARVPDVTWKKKA